jgi:uncharacterized RDD family membrane protein YckC
MSENAVAPKATPDPVPPPEYAGFWARALALAVDFLILTACAVPLAPFGDAIYLIIPIAIVYLPFMWWRRGATLGQRAVGIRVVRASDGGRLEFWRAALRGLAWWPAFALIKYYAGIAAFALAAFEPRKRALHDIVARTAVVFDESESEVANAFRPAGGTLLDDLVRGLFGRRKGRS